MAYCMIICGIPKEKKFNRLPWEFKRTTITIADATPRVLRQLVGLR
jgi:hypothetical protein